MENKNRYFLKQYQRGIIYFFYVFIYLFYNHFIYLFNFDQLIVQYHIKISQWWFKCTWKMYLKGSF